MDALIIGASGLVGSHVMRVLKNENCNVVGTHLNFETQSTIRFDSSEEKLEEFLKRINFVPQIVIHCAALTNVDLCEINAEKSYNDTVLPTQLIVDYCERYDVKMVYISTDYVFDGKHGPYSETDEVCPINIYGKHKLMCEEMVSQLKQKIILRITNVYGEEARNKNFVSRLLEDFQKNQEKVLNLPSDQFATPIYAGDIARMLDLLLKDQKIGTYHLSSTDYYNRFQLAKKTQSYFPNNKSMILNAVETKLANQAANRPLNGGLIGRKFFKEYPLFISTNVDSYILKNKKYDI